MLPLEIITLFAVSWFDEEIFFEAFDLAAFEADFDVLEMVYGWFGSVASPRRLSLLELTVIPDVF